MAININHEKCTLCGLCIEVCPFSAISVVDDKITIDEKCTLCGLCVKECPEGALENEEKGEINQEKGEYIGIWFFAETRGEELATVSLEMLSAALKLKAGLPHQPVSAVIFGQGSKKLGDKLLGYGADKVYVIDDERLDSFREETYARALAQLISKHKPNIVIAGATMMGRAFIPSVAAKIKTGLTADCTDINIDEDTGLLVQTRPTFGGNLMARIVCREHRPQMATIRPKIFDEAVPAGNGKNRGEIVEETFEDNKPDPIKTNKKEKMENIIDLQEAEIIVSGGRGLQEPKNFAMIKELADLLGGAVGSSRAAVDAGWIPYPHQVGQTGKTVKPKIYIACGISGAIQHLAGMQTSDYIIAINKDPAAPIFKMANLGVVGDVFEVVPLLIKKLKKDNRD